MVRTELNDWEPGHLRGVDRPSYSSYLSSVILITDERVGGQGTKVGPKIRR